MVEAWQLAHKVSSTSYRASTPTSSLPYWPKNWALLEHLEKLQPFGEGNRPPVFCARGLLVSGVDPVGADGKHLRLAVRSPRGKIVRMIGFRFGHLLGTLRLGQTVDVAFELGVNEWNGRRDIQFKITDLKL